MTKNVVAQTFIRPIVSGRYYARNPNDSTGPSAPTQLQAVPHDTTINVQWVNGIDPDTGIASTLLQYRLNGTTTWTNVTIPYLGTSPLSTTYTIPNLTPLKAYDIQIVSLNNASPQVPSAPTNITVSTTASDPALAPGTITLAVTNISAPENSQISVALVRSGAGASSQAVTSNWAFSGFGQGGSPSPANGPVTWAAGENGSKTFLTTAGNVGQNVTGILQIIDASSPSGLQPTIGTPSQASVTVVNVAGTGTKHNPGYYGGSQNPTDATDTKLTQQIAEQNLVLSSGPNVLGLSMYYYPAALETAGAFDFSKIRRDLNRLRSMSTPKRLIATIYPNFYGSVNYTKVVPPSILNDSSYGPSPVAGSYGWWTIQGNTGMSLAWWRPNVMTRMINLYNAWAADFNSITGLTFDTDPFFELTSFGELGMGTDSGDPTFSVGACVTQYKRLIDAINDPVTGWKNTLHACQNNISFSNASFAQDLTNYCAANRTGISGPDTYVAGQHSPVLTGGQAAALGIGQTDSRFTGPDLRGIACLVSFTQAPELTSSRYPHYTPQTTQSQVNNVLKQGRMIVTMALTDKTDDPVPPYPQEGPNSGTNAGNWHSWLQVINGSPLAHVAKPTSLP